MPRLYDVYFVSSNPHKYREAHDIVGGFGICLGFLQHRMDELQSDSLQTTAERKAQDAFETFCKPVVVEDAGLFIDDLDGFPGPFSSYVFQTIGNEGILRLLRQNRKAKFSSVVAFCSGSQPKLFCANISGHIAQTSCGNGWGYDPIFVPEGSTRTFAQLNTKNTISHRFLGLEKFSNWYLRTLKSTGK